MQANIILRSSCRKLSPHERLANVGGHTLDLASSRPLTLGELARAVGGERELNAALTRVLHNGAWFAGQLPSILEDFVTSVRNPGAHTERIDRETARRWRERLIGVGCKGDLVELAGTRTRT